MPGNYKSSCTSYKLCTRLRNKLGLKKNRFILKSIIFNMDIKVKIFLKLMYCIAYVKLKICSRNKLFNK